MTEGNETASTVRAYMDEVLARLRQDSFGQRAAPSVSLSADTTDVPGKGLQGAIEVHVRTRNGNETLIHREPFAHVRTRDDVDDVFARTLSVVLMNHTDWPR